MKIIEHFTLKTLFGLEKSLYKTKEDIPVVFMSKKIDSSSLESKLLLKNYLSLLEKNPDTGVSDKMVDSLKNDYSINGEIECQYCKSMHSSESITLDHVVPFYFGGKNQFHNLKLSCSKCNWMKGAIHPTAMPTAWKSFNENISKNHFVSSYQVLLDLPKDNLTEDELDLVNKLIKKEKEWRENKIKPMTEKLAA